MRFQGVSGMTACPFPGPAGSGGAAGDLFSRCGRQTLKNTSPRQYSFSALGIGPEKAARKATSLLRIRRETLPGDKVLENPEWAVDPGVMPHKDPLDSGKQEKEHRHEGECQQQDFTGQAEIGMKTASRMVDADQGGGGHKYGKEHINRCQEGFRKKQAGDDNDVGEEQGHHFIPMRPDLHGVSWLR